ncbi:hypothetical protein IX83_03130 [Basilea psittacipulmonis DSM 24701]|uniref:Esterase n=2 Tax=Basilea TaxID=1472344 RepID=A0A077DGX6_9BURK|nr:hypothetical protein IX83_03130 [Basilea psittacipulmonis DSM 24701]
MCLLSNHIAFSLTQPINSPTTMTTHQSSFPSIANAQYQSFQFSAEDGKRHYRITMLIPTQTPPKAGFPVFYALDGNAFSTIIEPAKLETFIHQTPTVMVFIGYETDKRLDTESRAFDYTPPDPQGNVLIDPFYPTRKNGGAASFLQLFQTKIRPLVEQHAPINPQEQTLWGHSYGGLFVLYTLFTTPSAFQHYIAVDPSIWLHDGLILSYQQSFLKKALSSPISLSLEKSGLTPQQPTPDMQAISERRQLLIQAVPSLERISEILSKKQYLNVHYRFYPDETHGSLFRRSFQTYLSHE